MKKTIALTFALLLMTVGAFAQAAQPDAKKSKPAKAAKPAKAPKSDDEIQKCISDKLAANKGITNGAATVSSGEATLTGEAKNAGAKTSAGKAATGCGAKKVANNITVAEAPKPAKGAAKSAAPKK